MKPCKALCKLKPHNILVKQVNIPCILQIESMKQSTGKYV